jgi:hypothetical protein
MCGLIGMAGQLTGAEEKLTNQLLIVDALRGVDSTGVAVVSRNGDVKIAKALGNPYELFNTKAYDRTFLGMNSVVIGHNRWGTQGKINKTNAHPFEFDTLVGVHNGTLTSKHRLDSSMDFDVDSENLYHHIDKHGLHDAMTHLEGAWSLVWWDKLDSTLNFLRNSERPMWITKNESGSCMFWASEPWMLQGVLGRAGIKHQAITSTQEDMHYSFHVDNKGVIGKPKVTITKSRAVKVPSYSTWKNGQPLTVVVGGEVKPPFSPTSEGNSSVGVNKQQSPTVKGLLQKTTTDYYTKSDLLLVIVGSGKDWNGGTYYMCEDEQSPNSIIRFYSKNGDKELKNGDLIMGAVGPLYRDNVTESAYYKVLHSTVTYDVDTTLSLKDSAGKDITIDEFYTRYHSCAICTGWVDPEKPHRFVASSDDAVCDICCEDTSVNNFVRLR